MFESQKAFPNHDRRLDRLALSPRPSSPPLDDFERFFLCVSNLFPLYPFCCNIITTCTLCAPLSNSKSRSTRPLVFFQVALDEWSARNTPNILFNLIREFNRRSAERDRSRRETFHGTPTTSCLSAGVSFPFLCRLVRGCPLVALVMSGSNAGHGAQRSVAIEFTGARSPEPLRRYRK